MEENFLDWKTEENFFTFMEIQRIVIDVGNTHTLIGVYKADTKTSWRVESCSTRTADEYWSAMQSLAMAAKVNLKATKVAALSCVVPRLTGVFKELFQRYLNCYIINVNSETDLNITYPVSDASYIGADLIVDAYGAIEKYCTNCLVCDFGSATTLELIGADRYFYGTIICPGLQTSAEGLVSRAAQLTGVELSGDFGILGTSTREAMLSGIIRGHALMIDGFISEIRNEFHSLNPIKVVATGGIANLVSRYSKLIDVVDESLTLDGLDLICQRLFG